MHVLWLTARSMADLCSTTQRNLVGGLLGQGHRVTFVNGDEMSPLEHNNFTHVSLPINARRGFQAKTLGKAMGVWLSDRGIDEDSTVAVVEWRVARQVVSVLESKGIPWALMDRSPPADAGLLSRLQWRPWSSAWRKAKQADVEGFVVSPAHQDFVTRKTGHQRTTVLQAGVDLERFKPGEKRFPFTMVYHGRLDRHRGVLACVMLAQKARLEGIEVDLVLIGEGNLESALMDVAQTYEFLKVHPSMPQDQLAQLLATCHLGLLPMPNRRVWRLASPLKRSEYLASGLAVFGIDHDGHALRNVESEWFRLVQQEDFHIDGLDFIREFMSGRLQVSEGPRLYAETNLSWNRSTSLLIEKLNDLVQRDS
tara:strand:- start:2346 stop:3446 length:1101 start_codon:yes stop_codon:yes gene_type:complete